MNLEMFKFHFMIYIQFPAQSSNMHLDVFFTKDHAWVTTVQIKMEEVSRPPKGSFPAFPSRNPHSITVLISDQSPHHAFDRC